MFKEYHNAGELAYVLPDKLSVNIEFHTILDSLGISFKFIDTENNIGQLIVLRIQILDDTERALAKLALTKFETIVTKKDIRMNLKVFANSRYGKFGANI